MSRVLAIDYGRRRVGFAWSDPTRTIVSDSTTHIISNPAEAVKAIVEYVRSNEVGVIVIGYPVREDGKPGEVSEDVDKLIETLNKRIPDIEIVKSDERYTSSVAEDIIHATGGKVGRDKGKVDAKAAEVILRDHLESGESG